MDPQLVDSLIKGPNKVPLISETPSCNKIDYNSATLNPGVVFARVDVLNMHHSSAKPLSL